jgi:hypothetical protein
MAHELGYAAALLLGFFGSTHCIAMCGGIVVALNQMLPEARGGEALPASRPLAGHLLYSLGRIASYAVAGGVAGSLGFVLAQILGASGTLALRIAFGALLMAVGAYVAGWWLGAARLEALGEHLWRRLSPVMRHFRPADRAWKLLALGAVWGWLPCGLVYGALAGAAASGSGARGALLMASFGAGTLPALLATGAFALQLRRFTARRGARWVTGGLIAAFGAWTILGAILAPRGAHDHGALHSTAVTFWSANGSESRWRLTFPVSTRGR